MTQVPDRDGEGWVWAQSRKRAANGREVPGGERKEYTGWSSRDLEQVRTCQKCGCTDDKGCIVESDKWPYRWVCPWVGPTHCSACFPAVNQRGRCEAHMPSHPDVAAGFTLITSDTCPICRLEPSLPGQEEKPSV